MSEAESLVELVFSIVAAEFAHLADQIARAEAAVEPGKL